MLETGIKGIKEIVVKPAESADMMKSGSLPVYATPAMIALMEETALDSVQPFLDEGFGTVGTAVSIKHLAPSLVGDTIRCESELTLIDRRRLEFNVRAYKVADGESIMIGEGTHERFIVDSVKFMDKVRNS